MPGLQMAMGLGGNAGAGGYSGPVFGAADVPTSGGYPDTAPSRAMTFGPGSTGGGGAQPATIHALSFGVLCFAGLLFLGWALPR